MNEAFKSSTVITVAHRLNTVINSDRILVLEGGLLKEYDNPQTLLKNPNSFFASLYNESQKESKMWSIILFICYFANFIIKKLVLSTLMVK